jgi:hypothetical protein
MHQHSIRRRTATGVSEDAKGGASLGGIAFVLKARQRDAPFICRDLELISEPARIWT